MKKKSIVFVLFTLFLSVLILSNGQRTYANEDDYVPTSNADGTVTITKYIGSAGDVTIPSELGGKTVTGIGSYAFRGTGLTTITIPTSVTEIGSSAFYDVSSLTTVKFEAGSALQTIGDWAFYKTGLTTITIPTSVTEIGSSAFYDVSSLTTVKFEAGSALQTIGDWAFYKTGLTTITLPKSVTEIGSYAFYVPSLKTVKFEGGSALETIGNDAFRNTVLTTITIPKSVIKIESYAFNVPSLEAVEFEDGSALETIGDDAFSKTGLTTITIPKSVTKIGSYAFGAAKSLSTVEFESGSELQTIGENAFRSTVLDKIKIPKSVTEIGKEAFYSASLLGTVEFESGSALQTIGENAFWSTALTSIRIPSSVVNMGDNIFAPKTDDFTIISLLDKTAHEYALAEENNHQHIPLYQLKYDGNAQTAGDVPEDKEEYLSEDLITVLPHGDLEKDGLRFVGWNTASDGRGQKVQAGEQLLYKDVGGTLYAQWVDNKHTIAFDSQGGDFVNDVVADYDTRIIAPTDPTKSGYTFAGWYMDAAFTTPWDFATDTVEGNMTLYAKWIADKHTITFDSQGGSAVPAIVADYETSITAPKPPTRSGRRFVGWYKDTDLTKPWNFAVDTIQGDLKLYAKWKVKPTPPPLDIQATMTADEALTEEQLNGSKITVNVSDTNFMMSLTPEHFELQNGPTGLTIREVKRISSTEAVITFAFDGTYLEQDHDLGLMIRGAALTNGSDVTVNDTLQIQKNKISYKVITKEGTFKPTKVWTVKLSNEVDDSTVQDALYIVDAEGNRIPSTFTSEGSNIFIQPPTGNYEEGAYTLYITSKLKNKNGTDLKEPIQMIFTIK